MYAPQPEPPIDAREAVLLGVVLAFGIMLGLMF